MASGGHLHKHHLHHQGRRKLHEAVASLCWSTRRRFFTGMKPQSTPPPLSETGTPHTAYSYPTTRSSQQTWLQWISSCCRGWWASAWTSTASAWERLQEVSLAKSSPLPSGSISAARSALRMTEDMSKKPKKKISSELGLLLNS